MLKKKSFVKLMNVLKVYDERREAMAEAFGAMYNFVPEREAIMSKNDAECVILDLFGDNGEILDWLKKEMNDQYEYIDWFTSECEYGKSPKILYVPYRDLDEDKKLYNLYFVDSPAMVFDIITNPNFGMKNTVCLDEVKNNPRVFVHDDKTEQYIAIGTCNKQGRDGIIVTNAIGNEYTYTLRDNMLFVLEGETDNSDRFIEQFTNQTFVDDDEKITVS